MSKLFSKGEPIKSVTALVKRVGTKVKVSIETEISKEDKKTLAKKLCGTWAGDPSIDSVFEEIEKERHSYHGRGIDLDPA